MTKHIIHIWFNDKFEDSDCSNERFCKGQRHVGNGRGAEGLSSQIFGETSSMKDRRKNLFATTVPKSRSALPPQCGARWCGKGIRPAITA